MAAFVITRTESIVKPGIAKFVPFKTEHVSYDTEAEAAEAFEQAYKAHTETYGDTEVQRDGTAFEAALSPFTKTFVELAVIQ